MRRRDVLAALAGSLSVAGCLSSAERARVCEGAWVRLWGLDGEMAGRHWTPASIRLGFTIPAGKALFVVYEAATILGTSHVTAGEHGLTADGHPVQLNQRLAGEHTIRAVLYADSDGNGGFDASTDTACQTDGDPIQAGPRTINFSKFREHTSAATAPEQGALTLPRQGRSVW